MEPHIDPFHHTAIGSSTSQVRDDFLFATGTPVEPVSRWRATPPYVQHYGNGEMD